MTEEELWDIYLSDEMNEERIGRTGDAWDEIAQTFFDNRGWTKSHMAYQIRRETNTLWVMTEHEPEVWEDTGISAREADRLLCDSWDSAEYVGFVEWAKEEHGIDLDEVVA